ncbi:SPOR domain-containing protein [Pseudomonas sp. Hp2]|uniref:SPOR domain-containing protein n=1 Tax=Pseudomonas sp. Hp2 TaxID=701189 RepID=UPI00112BE0B7|nr:SPOR domain-containing protein [Pseudomonas sp. Hp2]
MDTTLKQRLIGAAVLVALAVIFLPMLVKGPAPDSGVSDVPITAPAAPADGQYETRELPLVTPPGAAPAGGAVGMAGNAASAPAPVQDNPDAADLAPQGEALPPSVAAGNYAVNFGAYASQEDADKVIARLKQSQLPGFSEPTQIGGRPAWRVRIGPYASQAQAEAVRLQAVKVRSDVNAQVVTLDAKPAASTPAPAPAPAPARSEPLPPEPAKPVAAASKPAPAPAKPEPAKPQPAKPAPPAAPSVPAASNVGFAVQLGAFGRAEDANALRDKVRAAGFSAFVEQVRTDKGTLSRVRVGPVANRADAEQLRAQVAARVGISGMVRPHP